MGKIFVTSDTHFEHDKDFIWGPRGFNSVDEMNEKIIKNWNSIVTPEDTVYLLGDVMLGNIDWGTYCLKNLNGNINILIGNHDTDNRIKKYKELFGKVNVLGYATILNYGKYSFYLSHYPTLTAYNTEDFRLKGTRPINLCGHSHVKDPFYDWDKGVIFHCEMDTNNCYPWLLDDIIEQLKTKISDK